MIRPSVNCLVYSKDRACQLDAFLRSFKFQWKNWSEEARLSVIWTYSDESYLSGYYKLLRDHPDVNFVNQKDKDFKLITTEAVDLSLPYTVQFVDDIIFINPFSTELPDFKAFSAEEETTCLSLRLHPQVTYCYMLNIYTQPPQLVDGKWFWKNLPGDWGYISSTDGHFFRTCDIQNCFFNSYYSNPNDLEERMIRTIPYRPYARCFQEGKIINIPSNSVGKNITNRRGNISAKYLNDQYLSGLKINVEPFYGQCFNAVHFEKDYTWQ